MQSKIYHNDKNNFPKLITYRDMPDLVLLAFGEDKDGVKATVVYGNEIYTLGEYLDSWSQDYDDFRGKIILEN